LLLGLTLSIHGLASAGEPTLASADLVSRLDAALRDGALRGARIGALVAASDDGRVLYERDADRSLVPASNMKLLTSIAALSALGPTHRFTTRVYVDVAPDAEGSVDVLAIRGGGDPALTSEDLWRLSADLRRLGLRRVRKGLLLDASAFDGERWHPSWGATSSRAYHAPIGALLANYGAFSVEVQAGAEPGDPVRASIDPPIPYLRLVNRGSTGGSRAPVSLAVDRRGAGDTEEILVSGVARAGSESDLFYRSVLDPARHAGALLRMQLAANGIVVEGEDRLGPVPETMTLLKDFEGKSLADIVKLLLKYSNNAIGEMLVKALGASSGGLGSWSTGVVAVRRELVQLGVPLEGMAIADGSGLSYDNRVTPRGLVSILRIGAASFRFGPEFVAALPIAAADGTLKKRSAGAALRLRAKTGLLTRVTALSGYATSADGERLVFSVVVNGFRGSDKLAMAAVDRFAAELVKGRISDERIGSVDLPQCR
jgi:D-alanyl-D-alanine carboxypeptidase/D-alanyl-D-alanine-endopeptidase (penicillin-binding protein 4)